MKIFSLGRIVTSLAAASVVFSSHRQKGPGKLYLEHDIWIENLSDHFSDRIEIHNRNAPSLSASSVSNGNTLSVPLANMLPGKPSFAGDHQRERVLHELSTHVTVNNGVEKRVEYDMRTGEILRILIISADRKKIDVFDREGVLLETAEFK